MRIMHQSASHAILFAKLIQWLAIGLAIGLFTSAVFLDRFAAPDRTLTNILSITIILLTCATIFLVLMYQMWQFNEIRRIRNIEKTFSTLCKQINSSETRGERRVERYTMLVFMLALLISGGVISILMIQ